MKTESLYEIGYSREQLKDITMQLEVIKSCLTLRAESSDVDILTYSIGVPAGLIGLLFLFITGEFAGFTIFVLAMTFSVWRFSRSLKFKQAVNSADEYLTSNFGLQHYVFEREPLRVGLFHIDSNTYIEPI